MEPSGENKLSADERIYECVLDDTLMAALFRFHRELSITNAVGVEVVDDGGAKPASMSPSSAGNEVVCGGELPRSQRRSVECKCFVCNRMIAAVRFAPHLEKCIGIGRSARVSRRTHRAAKYAEVKEFNRVVTRSSTLALMEEIGEISETYMALEDEDEEEFEEDDNEEADGNWSRTSENGGSLAVDRKNRARLPKRGAREGAKRPTGARYHPLP